MKAVLKKIEEIEKDLGRELSQIEIVASLEAAFLTAGRLFNRFLEHEAWSQHWERVVEKTLRNGAEPFLRNN